MPWRRPVSSPKVPAGKPVEAMYYEDGRHNGIFDSSTQYRDEVQRMLAFLLHHLRD